MNQDTKDERIDQDYGKNQDPWDRRIDQDRNSCPLEGSPIFVGVQLSVFD
ncbi:hypothetical protein [Sphingobacterium sp.]|nr:hypothetical protein [Sphingobacterium sp.]